MSKVELRKQAEINLDKILNELDMYTEAELEGLQEMIETFSRTKFESKVA